MLNVISELFRCHGRKKAEPVIRRPIIAVAALTILAACSSSPEAEDRRLQTAQFTAAAQGVEGIQLADAPDTSTFVGAIVADEPRAVLAARSVLERGGSAVDAITALYFQLSVTMPHSAGLGGGGLCLVHDPENLEVTSYNFLARRSRAGGPVAIPGNVRGFALMHAVHGSAPWSSLVAPAEVLAAQGHEISNALARELAPMAPAISTLPQLSTIYLRPNGQPLRQGDNLVQTGLAAALGRIRANGPSGFYTGEVAAAFAEAANALGNRMTLDELRAYRPVSEPAQAIAVGDQTLSIPASSTGAGTYMASLWPIAATQDGPALLRAAQAELARAGAETNLPPLLGSTAFVVATAGGDAAACAVTMNGSFGTGRIVPGTGIVPARAPDAAGYGLAGAFLAPAIVANSFNGRFFFAGAGAGGPRASAAVLDLAANVVNQSKTLDQAQAQGVSDAQSLVNAVACPNGAPGDNASCTFSSDPNGAGLGAVGFPPNI